MAPRRWAIALVTSILAVPLLALALVPFWVGSAVFGPPRPGWAWGYATVTFLLLVTAIFVIVKIETSLVRWADDRRTVRNVARLARELAALRSDPHLAAWAPLAERYQRVDRAEIARWDARYRTLLADPRRRAFAERALSGEFPTDDEIDYLLDAGARRTCVHLRPVEDALRSAGIVCAVVRWPSGATADVATAARLDEPVLRTRYVLPAFVVWEVTPPEPHEAGSERLVCTRCRSAIENGRGAPFPSRDLSR